MNSITVIPLQCKNIKLYYDHDGNVVGARFNPHGLETLRITEPNIGGTNFNILYDVVFGSSADIKGDDPLSKLKQQS